MNHSTQTRVSACVLLFTLLAAPALHAQGLALQPGLEAARDDVVAAEIELRKSADGTKQACDEADSADDQLLKEGRLPSTFTQTLAKAAQVKRDLCDQWKALREKAQERADLARKQLRQVAAAAKPSVEVPAPIVIMRGAANSPPPAQIDLQTIVAQALEAQETVGKERKAVQGVYDTVDRATKAALRLKLDSDAGLVENARGMQKKAKDAIKAASDAQIAANHFLDSVLVIQACLISKAKDCGTLHEQSYANARAHRDKMGIYLAQAKKLRDDLDAAAATVEVAGAWDDPANRTKALQFAKMIEKYPDANAPFAQNAFTLLASNKDKSAAVKLGWDRLYPGGWRQVTLTFSAPLSERVFSYADGLTGLPKAGISYQTAGIGKLFGKESALFSTAWGLRFGYDKRSYYEDTAILQKQTTNVRVSPWDVSFAAVAHDPNTSNAHVLRLAWQRVFEDGPSKNRCPSGSTGDILFVDCITGKFGAPKAQNAGVLSYQYRYQMDSFAISPTVTYNTRSEVTELGLPLYLVRSADNDKRPFNAGIRADWTSKGKEAITGSTKNTWSFGVFVGTSFSLFSRDE